jgi:transposase
MEVQAEQWLQAATSGEAESFTFWTAVRLAVALTTTFRVRLSEATIRRSLHRWEYAWRRPRLCAPADDPEKEQRLQEIAATLQKGEQGELVFYEDETTVRLLPLIRSMWMKVGQQVRVVVPAAWNRGFTVFLALNPFTGAFVYELLDRHNGEAFVTFLEKLVATCPGRAIHFLLDNARYHSCRLVHEWLDLHPQVHLVWLPKRSPQCNPVEDLWRWLKPEIAANRTHHDLEPLRDACRTELDKLTPEEARRKAGLLPRKGGQDL